MKSSITIQIVALGKKLRSNTKINIGANNKREKSSAIVKKYNILAMFFMLNVIFSDFFIADRNPEFFKIISKVKTIKKHKEIEVNNRKVIANILKAESFLGKKLFNVSPKKYVITKTNAKITTSKIE